MNTSAGTSRTKGKTRGTPGRKGDTRMSRALEAREKNPELSLLQALLEGGFDFPDLGYGTSDKKMRDTDGVTLFQRKNQLMRRQREAKQKNSKTPINKKKEKLSSARTPRTNASQTPEQLRSTTIKHTIQPKNNEFTEKCNTIFQPDNVVNEKDSKFSNLFDAMKFEDMIYPQEEERERLILSEKEKDEIVNDLRGITDIPGTYSIVTDNHLYEFDEALNEIPFAGKMSLVKAQGTTPDLVSKKQKAMFLRWAEFDVERAAARFVTYWNHRHKLFGDDAFFPLTMDRVTDRDRMTFDSGVFNILPHKDEHGRCVVWGDPSRYNRKIHKRESVIRSVWYKIHAALEDESIQEIGFVIIGNLRNANIMEHFDRSLERMMWHSITECLPIKIRAIHAIKPSPFDYLIMPIVKFLFGRMLRLRFVIHSGTEKETLEELSTYGISEKIYKSGMMR